MKKAAVINDLSGFGKCSLTAALPVLSVLGVQCVPMPTAVLTGQTGYEHYYCRDLTDMIPQFTDAWERNQVHFDAIYSGYLTGPAQISHLREFIRHFRKKDTFLLVDPVMGDNGHTYSMYSKDLLEGMKELSRCADLITPNLTEACLLADMDVTDIFSGTEKTDFLEIAREAAHKLRSLSHTEQDIVITGIKYHNPEASYIYNLAASKEGFHTTRCHFFDRSFSGTGDLFASCMCGLRLTGYSTRDSMQAAQAFLYKSIEDAVKEGNPGNDGVNFEKYLACLLKPERYSETELKHLHYDT